MNNAVIRCSEFEVAEVAEVADFRPLLLPLAVGLFIIAGTPRAEVAQW